MVTDSALSPIAGIADARFEIVESDFGAFRSLAATFCLAMTLAVAVAEKRGERRRAERSNDRRRPDFRRVEAVVDAAEEADEIVGHEIDVRTRTGLAIVRLAKIVLTGFPAPPASSSCRATSARQVLGDVLEHRRASRLDAMAKEEGVIGGVGGFRDQAGGYDVERVLEQTVQAELAQRAQRMIARAVGEDQFAARQPRISSASARLRRQPGAIDVVDEIEKFCGEPKSSSTRPRNVVPCLLIVISLQRARRLAVEAGSATRNSVIRCSIWRHRPLSGG